MTEKEVLDFRGNPLHEGGPCRGVSAGEAVRSGYFDFPRFEEELQDQDYTSAEPERVHVLIPLSAAWH